MNESLSLQENWQYLLPTVKFEISSENWNFKKLVSTIMSVRVSWYLKTCLMRSVMTLMTVIFSIEQWNESTFERSA